MDNKSPLTERVIRNSFYQVALQLVTFLFPLILTPLIVSGIGEEQFGIYALVLGFITVFGLFDFSISSSFVVFLSRHFENNDRENLISTFNAGLFFYALFSIVICGAGLLLRESLLSVLNIPESFKEISVTVYNLGLLIFLVNSVFAIFSSALISMQKMYITSASGIAGAFLNFILTVTALYSGYGLTGIVAAQLITAVAVSGFNAASAFRLMPGLKISPASVKASSLKEMMKFGSQMQISKLATFASEKYDEFLLAHFTSLGNVTYFNIASRISRTGRLIPFQIIPQIAPVAASLKARNEERKLANLFEASSRYLTLAAAPVFVFIFAFSDLIINTWMGEGFGLSADILKVLAAGQLFNMAFSAPGNSVIPNTGEPRYQMHEGLINLAFNIVLSFLLIKYYGILGAAIGSVISTLIASSYVYFRSANHYGRDVMKMLTGTYMVPFSSAANAGIVSFAAYYVAARLLHAPSGRPENAAYLAAALALFVAVFAVSVHKTHYLTFNDKVMISKILSRLIPLRKLLRSETSSPAEYSGGKISLFIVTHGRLGMLRKCIDSLLPTLRGFNFELIIIDNASDDGTPEYLNELSADHAEITVVRNPANRGTNAKAQAADMAAGEFIVGIDDDVISFPVNWLSDMIRAYRTIPGMGYLATDVVSDETTTGAKHPPEMYMTEDYGNGIRLSVGPTGGWCFMISRKVYEDVGKLLTFSDRIFFSEDGDYVNRIKNKGYKYGILEGVKVYHATGDYHNREYKAVFDEKYSDYKKGNPAGYRLRTSLKNLVSYRRILLKIDSLSRQTPAW